MSFKDIIGHDSIKSEIINSINSNKFSHAHIISGENGIGKSIIAKETAILLLEKKEYRDYVDIIHYRLNKNKKSIGVDEVRDLIDEINKKPYEGDKKVVIVYNGDLLTEAAQNAFLKTIEEPPQGVYILLLCENMDNVLDTIKSRCQIHNLRRLKEDEIIGFIKNKYPDMFQDKIQLVATFSDGIPGRVERFVEDKSLEEIRNVTLRIIESMYKNQDEDILIYEEFFIKYKDVWEEVFTWLISYVRDALIYKETSNKSLMLNVDKFTTVKDIAEMFSFNKLNDIINIIVEAKNKLARNVNAALVYDTMLLKLKEV